MLTQGRKKGALKFSFCFFYYTSSSQRSDRELEKAHPMHRNKNNEKKNKTAGRKNKKGLLLSATCNMECLHYYCGLKTGAQPQTHPNPGVIENGKRPDQRRKDFSFTFEPIDKAQGSERN
jgi:hypothetical protein